MMYYHLSTKSHPELHRTHNRDHFLLVVLFISDLPVVGPSGKKKHDTPLKRLVVKAQRD